MTSTVEGVRALTLAAPPASGPAEVFAEPRALDLVIEMAHDFRTPLSSVLVLAELLEGGRFGPLNPLQRQQLRLILGAVRSLCVVADDVVDVARGGGELAGTAVAFDVAPVLETVAELARPMALAKGLRLDVSSSVEGRRHGHPRAIERVLLNLVTNAVKYTDHGTVEMKARPVDGRGACAARPIPRRRRGSGARLLPFRPRAAGVPPARHGDGCGVAPRLPARARLALPLHAVASPLRRLRRRRRAARARRSRNSA